MPKESTYTADIHKHAEETELNKTTEMNRIDDEYRIIIKDNETVNKWKLKKKKI
jgi:hypothetical protein